MPSFLRAIAARGFNIQKTGDKTGMTQVTLKQDGKTLTALLSGEIDHHWAAILREKIDERAAAAAPAILILDFSAVTFMDSSGIGLILGRHKLISAMGGVVVVQKAPKDIKRHAVHRGHRIQRLRPRAKRSYNK